MKNIINFVLKSSADPRATSLSVKFALLAIIKEPSSIQVHRSLFGEGVCFKKGEIPTTIQ